MTQKEAIKRLYGIDNEVTLNKIDELRDNINEIMDTNWSTLFVLDLLGYFMMHDNIINLINNYIAEKDKSNFSKRVDVFLSVVSSNEIIEMISKFLDIEPKRIGQKR